MTTGDRVLCEPEGDAYTLSFLKAPTAPGTLPTGRPVDVLLGVPVSLVRYGNPYVFVDSRRLDGSGLEGRLLALRAEAARRLGYPPGSALPKVAAFTDTPDGLFVRALTVGGWHPGSRSPEPPRSPRPGRATGPWCPPCGAGPYALRHRHGLHRARPRPRPPQARRRAGKPGAAVACPRNGVNAHPAGRPAPAFLCHAEMDRHPWGHGESRHT
ncbi:hypothetical protein O1L60_21470 [Streptomyces diastatochromogenes]|nr:hypothetical protein [Streptomyces diastatochromogenes]